MSLLGVLVVMVIVLAGGYWGYGAWVAKQLALDPNVTTPAVTHEDGVDYVPTRPFYLLGQHFSAIAAAGPIAGPILACQQFGWLPCLLWIGFGVVFIGAVHDMATLVASMRHDARSIAEVVRQHIGRRAWIAIMAFIWVALIYVIVAFTSITATTFVSGDADMAGLAFRYNPGGAVAMASVLYLALALTMGLVEKFIKPPLWLQTIIFVPATLASVYAGTRLSTVLVSDARTWAIIILAYCFVASLTPVWALLQPRGYLGGFVLYLAIAVGLVGVLFGGYEIQQPAFTAWSAPGAGFIFPFLFVTIACGACSGFHGLVCSGTTSKQIAKEPHAKAVGYGAMLLEGLVAVLALGTIMIVSKASIAGKAPGAIYGAGLGQFLTVIIGKKHLAFATTFGAMAFSTFIFDTLDVSTRLGRYVIEELFGLKGKTGAIAGTAATTLVPLAFVLYAGAKSYLLFWTLFGTSNQLLAALSLLAISVWLKRAGRRYMYTLIPTGFILTITVTSLVLQIKTAIGGKVPGAAMNGIVSGLLLLLAGAMLIMGARALVSPAPAPPTPPARPGDVVPA